MGTPLLDSAVGNTCQVQCMLVAEHSKTGSNMDVSGSKLSLVNIAHMAPVRRPV